VLSPPMDVPLELPAGADSALEQELASSPSPPLIGHEGPPADSNPSATVDALNNAQEEDESSGESGSIAAEDLLAAAFADSESDDGKKKKKPRDDMPKIPVEQVAPKVKRKRYGGPRPKKAMRQQDADARLHGTLMLAANDVGRPVDVAKLAPQFAPSTPNFLASPPPGLPHDGRLQADIDWGIPCKVDGLAETHAVPQQSPAQLCVAPSTPELHMAAQFGVASHFALAAVGSAGLQLPSTMHSAPGTPASRPPPDAPPALGTLEPGWRRAFSKSHNRSYYVHEATGESRWLPPVESDDI